MIRFGKQVSAPRAVARWAFFRFMPSRMKRRLLAWTCASSEEDCAPLAPARLHQNEQPKLCSEVLIASIVCLHVPSMVDFADGFLAMSTHIFRVWSSCAL